MNIKKLNEEIDALLAPKYFYLVGDSEVDASYWDSDIYATVPDTRTIHNGYVSEKFDTFEACIDSIIDEGYYKEMDKINFPKDLDLEEVTEMDCTPEDNINFVELLSYWCEVWEEEGPEERPVDVLAIKFIQVCKDK